MKVRVGLFAFDDVVFVVHVRALDAAVEERLETAMRSQSSPKFGASTDERAFTSARLKPHCMMRSRCLSSLFFQSSIYAAMSSGVAPGSVVEVMPSAESIEPDCLSPSIRRSRVTGGSSLRTRFIAGLSIKNPVGSPFASRTMTPPFGSTVSLLIPASFSASEFATATCPPRGMKTGFCGEIASSSWRVGMRPRQSVLRASPMTR